MRNAFSWNDRDEPRGHVIATLKVWQNGVQLDLQNYAKCTSIVLADLASGEEGDGTNTRRMASFRKSMSGLCGVLRSLLQQEQHGLAANVATYRECMLTKVLQRPLLDCRIVILASVSASVDSYQRTLYTLNYINRLLIRPGKTARSPFQQHKGDEKLSGGDGIHSPTPNALFQYGDNATLLRIMLSDPRQRLAKLMPSRFITKPVKLELSDSEDEGYEPYAYMQIDPGATKESDSPASPLRNELEDARRADSVEGDPHEYDDDYFNDEIGGHEARDEERIEIVSDTRVIRRSEDESKDNARANVHVGDKRAFGSAAKDWLAGKSRNHIVSGVDPMQFKAVMSLSEESSTQPTESMTSSARTGLRAMHSPVDVDEWIASFEAKQDDSSDAPHVVASDKVVITKGIRRSTEPDACKDEFQSSSSNGKVTKSRNSTSTEHGGIVSETSESVQVALRHRVKPLLDDDAVTDMARDFDDVGVSGTESEDQDSTEHEIHEAGRRVDKSPFVERKQAFSTPIAYWPELDDDHSALSLSSFRQDVGNDAHRASQNEQTHHATKTDNAFNISGSQHLAPSQHNQPLVGQQGIPSNVETPSRTHDGINRLTALSPTEQCVEEIHVLEDAVEQIKRLHNGLWETSALSLDRLRRSQEMQQRFIEEAVTARKEAEAETKRLETALARELEERGKLARAYGERLAAMENRIEKTLMDRDDMEKIAEEAIAAQDRLEQDLSRTQNELDSQRTATESAVSKYNHEHESCQNLTKQLELAMSSLNKMRSAHGDCKEVIADLGATIESLRVENEKLTEERDASQALSSDQSRIIEEQERLKCQFEKCQQEISALQEENETLTANLREYKVRFKKAEEQQKAFRIQFESENLALQNDLDEWQRRFLEVEDAGERAAQDYMEERAMLLNEVSSMKEQLDQSGAQVSLLRQADVDSAKQRDEEIDFLTSEMRELQLERERDRNLLTNTEEKYEKLRTDVKEKLKQLVKEKKAATTTIEKLRDENAAHVESNQHLRSRIERAERECELLQNRMTGLLERLEVEELARKEAEDRIQQLSSRRLVTESNADPGETSSCFSLHLEPYTEADQALLKEIEAEKSRAKRHGDRFGNGRAVSASELGDIREQRAMFAQLRRDLDARYASEKAERGLVSVDMLLAEKSRRLQAEDLAAVMAARAKDGFEKRNEEIMNLKLEMCKVADEKEAEILRLRNQIHSLKRETLS